MQCYKCYKAIEDGEVETLKEIQGHCNLYKANQCHVLPVEDSIGDKAMKATMSLFPQALKGKLPALCLVILIFTLGAVIPILNVVQSHRLQATVSEALEIIQHREEALLYLTNREIIQHYNSDSNHWLRMEVLSRAETVPWNDLMDRAQENPDLLIRLHGYITSMQADFLFGSYISLGPSRNFSPTDVRINFDSTEARLGDEVIIFLIPVFGGHDTPLRSWEWTQIRNP